MARPRYRDVALSPEGTALHILPNAEITIFNAGTSTPYASPVYAGDAGATEKGNPFTADAYGNFEFFLASPLRVKITAVSGAQTVTWDLEPVMPAPADIVTLTGAATLTNKALTAPTINGGTIDGATITNPSGDIVSLDGAQTLTNKTLSSPTVTGVLTGGRLMDRGGAVINVKGFGAGPDVVGTNEPGETDSDAIDEAFTEAVTLAVAMHTSSGDGRTLTIRMPAGVYNLARPIVPPLMTGLTVEGDGMEATVIGLSSGAGTDNAATWENQAMLYVCGQNFMALRNLSIRGGASDYLVTDDKSPEAGLVIAGNASGSDNIFGDAIGANITNQIIVESVRVAGAFVKTAIANYANVSSEFHNVSASRSKSWNASSPNGVNMDECTVYIGAHNAIGLHNPPSGPALVAPNAGAQASDLKWYGGEVEDNVGIDTDGSTKESCNCPAVWFEEAYAVHFQTRNISGRGNPVGYVRFSPGLTSVGNLYGCRGIVLEVTQMYEGDSVDPSQATPCAIGVTGNTLDNAAVARARILNDSGAPATYEAVVSDLVVRNSHIKVVSGGSLLGGARHDSGSGTVTYIRPRIENVQLQDAATGNVNTGYLAFFGGATTGALIDARADCDGLQIDLNGAQPRRGVFYRPGTIVDGAGTAVIEHGATGVQEYANANYLAWRNAANSGTYQIVGLDGSDIVQLGDSNVARINANKALTVPTLSGTPIANALYSGLIVKAWGYLDTDATVLAGQNITSASKPGGATGQYRVVLDRDFGSGSYAVIGFAHFDSAGSTATLVNVQEQISGRGAGQFDLIANRLSDGAAIDTKVSFICLGTQ